MLPFTGGLQEVLIVVDTPITILTHLSSSLELQVHACLLMTSFGVLALT